MAPSVTRTAQLVARAQAGDADAYDQLFALASDRVRLYARLRLGPGLRSRVETDDVLQEAYLAAHKAFDRFRYEGEEAFTRWLCRIAENAIRGLSDHHRARKRTPPAGMARVSRILDRLHASATGPATAATRQEHAKRLIAGVDALADDEREVLLLRFFQGRTLDDIAHLTGRSPSTTRRLLGRATASLGAHLESTS